MLPSNTSLIYQSAQIEEELKKRIHIIFNTHVEFQVHKSLNPNHPSNFLLVTVSQETLAVPFPSMCHFQRNLPHKELISYVTLFGRMKELDQELVMHVMTVFSNWR